jgi:AAA+ ATPase superfamily predicted ATPase
MPNGSMKAPAFFGRKEVSALLEKRLESFLKGYRQNVGIIGQPLIGKTSVVRFFLNRISNHNEIIPVFFSCQEFDSFERFSEKWMGEILFAFQTALGQPFPENVQTLLRANKSAIPKTMARMKLVKRLVLKKRYDQAYQELLSLSGIMQQESGRKVLMILDEFDRLSELGLKDPFSNFGKEMMVQKETMFLVTTSRPERGLAIFREKLSLLFANFEIVKLGPFDFDECREFMNSHFLLSRFSEALRRFVIRMTNGCPYYLEVLASRLERCAFEAHLNDRKLLIEAFKQELDSPDGVLNHYFQGRIYESAQGKPWPFFADVLTALALGYKKLFQTARFLKVKSTDLKKAFDRLVLMEMVEKHGSFYHVPDPLFRFWLEQVCYRRRFLTCRSPIAGAKRFEEEADEIMEEHIREDQEELPKRMSQLLLKFQNDSVELNGKKFGCPHFTEVAFRPNNGRVFPVYAKNGSARWLCQILSNPVTEEDVRTFCQDLKHYKFPIQKKLVVGLRGIDLNAKLLAQEAKIQYLDLKTLNVLLDLYDKPKLVV